MRGSVNYQVQCVFRESGINCIGQSKHSAKESARESLAESGVTAGWHEVGKCLGVFSFGTADAYRDVWRAVFRHAKNMFGLKDLEHISGVHIRSYLDSKIQAKISSATFNQYAAALEKFEVALNSYSEKFNRGCQYSFSADIAEVRLCAGELEKFEGSRAYSNPRNVIGNLVDPEHIYAAQFQFESGARVKEIALIRAKQLRGLQEDPVTGESKGVISVKGKGGKIRDIRVSPEIYSMLEQKIERDGLFQFNRAKYQTAIKVVVQNIREVGYGTHGFRWNWAQSRFRVVQQKGLTYEQALSLVSREMGHVRADITEHYLK